MPIKVREAIRRVQSDGWYLTSTRGSHRQFEHPVKPGKVTIAGHPSQDLPDKTWHTILQQAGLRRSNR